MSAVDPFADDPFADPPPAAPAAPPLQPETTAVETSAPVPDVPEAPPFIEPQSAGSAAEVEIEADLEPTPPPPVVDREGAPVTVEPEPVAEVPPPPSEPVPPVDPPQAPPEAQEPAQEPPEPPVAPVEPPAAPAAPTTTGGTEASSNGAAVPDPAPDADAPPDPNAPKKGHRHYVILYQTGPAEFTKVDLSKHQSSEWIARTVEAAAKEGDPPVVDYFLEARNNDHAYKLCFTVLGRPQAGVTVLPLPKASWRPRLVKPAPPKPEAERLVIT